MKVNINDSKCGILDNEQWVKGCAGELIAEKFSQSELNDLVRDLDLCKESSEVLTSRLNKTNADARI